MLMRNLCMAMVLAGLAACQHEPLREFSSVDILFADWDQADVPGGALGIVKEGKLIYARGYGSADLEHDIPITPSSVFYVGSVSKQFVTFCVLLLEEQGKLNLDDAIQKYLPGFPDYGSPLTIRHLIHHTSGLRDYLTLMSLMGKNYLDHIEDEEVYGIIKRQSKLNFPPGEQYMYSNSGYFLLAMIIEKAAGQSLREFAGENIFTPLGMVNTRFHDDHTELIKNRVFSYAKKPDQEGFDNLIMRFDLVGSGGVYSSIQDLFLWDRNFYDNILGKGGQDIIRKMHEEGLLNNGESSGYAFALNIGTHHGLKTVSHGGSLAGYRAQLMRFPEQHFSVIILANRSDANPAEKAYQVADIFLGNLYAEEGEVNETEPETGESEKHVSGPEISGMDLQEYAGEYYSRELNTTYRLFTENEALKVKFGSSRPMRLDRSGEDQFRVAEEGLLFRFRRKAGNVTGYEMDAGNVLNLAFERK
jgi:CubicO group peptidase (beta-lactamase class C family)